MHKVENPTRYFSYNNTMILTNQRLGRIYVTKERVVYRKQAGVQKVDNTSRGPYIYD